MVLFAVLGAAVALEADADELHWPSCQQSSS